MTIREILNITKHRPWSIPSGPWKFYQEWNRAIFLHWQVDFDELSPLVPKELEIDLIQGKPMVSLVAFTMEKIRPRYLPAFKPISNFDEINVRTYVKSGHKTGVYFLSIEGGKRLSCKVARGLSQLPYRHSEMKRSHHHYYSKNGLEGDIFDIRYAPGKPVGNKSELDMWLTERYALFQDHGRAINEFEILHPEWPVRELKINKLLVDYPLFQKLMIGEPYKTHYSDGVQVVAWGKKRIF